MIFFQEARKPGPTICVCFAAAARRRAISPATARRFLRYLELSYQVLVLRPYHRNQEKRLSRMPRGHFLDPGVLRSVLRRRGSPTGEEFESAVVAEVYKQVRNASLPVDFFHLRTYDGREVDLLIETEAGFVAMEIKMAEHVHPTDARPLRELGAFLDRPLLKSLVLSRDRQVRLLSPEVLALPAAWALAPPSPRLRRRGGMTASHTNEPGGRDPATRAPVIALASMLQGTEPPQVSTQPGIACSARRPRGAGARAAVAGPGPPRRTCHERECLGSLALFRTLGPVNPDAAGMGVAADGSRPCWKRRRRGVAFSVESVEMFQGGEPEGPVWIRIMPVTFSNKLTRSFAGNIRSRGARIFQQGRVRVLDGRDASVLAIVTDTRRYHVGLFLRKTVLEVSCTCPYFSAGLDPCKHIWAAILAAERNRALAAAARIHTARLPVKMVEMGRLDDQEYPDAQVELCLDIQEEPFPGDLSLHSGPPGEGGPTGDSGSKPAPQGTRPLDARPATGALAPAFDPPPAAAGDRLEADHAAADSLAASPQSLPRWTPQDEAWEESSFPDGDVPDRAIFGTGSRDGRGRESAKGWGSPSEPAQTQPPLPPSWLERLSAVKSGILNETGLENPVWHQGREVLYLIDFHGTVNGNGLVVELRCRDRRKNGHWSVPRPLLLRSSQVSDLPEPLDRTIVSLLFGARQPYSQYSYYYLDPYSARECRFLLTPAIERTLIPLICRTGRCRLLTDRTEEATTACRSPEPVQPQPRSTGRQIGGGAGELQAPGSSGATPRAVPGNHASESCPNGPPPGDSEEQGEPQALAWAHQAASGSHASESHSNGLPPGESKEQHEPQALAWSDGAPWRPTLEVRPDASGTAYDVSGSLRRGEERRSLSEPLLLTAGGLVFFPEAVGTVDDAGALPLLNLLRREGNLHLPREEGKRFLQEILALPHFPTLDLPEELRYEEVNCAPRPLLRLRSPERWLHRGPTGLRGELSFDYEGSRVPAAPAGRGVFDPEGLRFVLRDEQAEQAARARLFEVGFVHRHDYDTNRKALVLNQKKLPRVVQTLTGEGWSVEAEGRLYRRPGSFRIEVKSGIDWFDLQGEVSFDGQTAGLPELLAALKRGENTILLGDGTLGMLPEDWLARFGLVAGIAEVRDGSLRFTAGQVGWLDALLASEPEATFDAGFRQARERLLGFAGIEPLDPPESFRGRLRGYQRDGLGWFRFLEEFGFGGCLADDMGLGKTVQALALLEARRPKRERLEPGCPECETPGRLVTPIHGRPKPQDKTSKGRKPPGHPAGPLPGSQETGAGPHTGGHEPEEEERPSLVVAPKSLVFNWLEEARRFAPGLRVLDFTGTQRHENRLDSNTFDLAVTTYGTLRRDVLYLKEVLFDYVILDEAQAIKNASTQAAKAALLLKSRHRLALSGTPVENHLGELWSLFEFLNPGLLGKATVFKRFAGAKSLEENTRALLGRALRPFILRRTKGQVAPELPRKTEQTIHCEMGVEQRRLYQEMREHYRRTLLGLVDRTGIGKAKIQILEALLRLRQAACHPGLLDPRRGEAECAKFEALLPQLQEVLDEGHKALVFSQFTRFLGILRHSLDRQGVSYAYLDGKTTDRAAVVRQFQTDPACRLFLISLKAGGLGLNLTAATYVFLLDPWWNPAVEAQAIDRTHRIGQTEPIFAYRLITRATIEEKILELQQSKRDLADAIITEENSLIRRLTREDLELLLS